jgi:hypothetical protein
VTRSAPSPTATSPSRDRTELGVLLAQLGVVLLSTETVGTTVELVTALAAEAIPGAAGAGVTLVDDRASAASPPRTPSFWAPTPCSTGSTPARA